MKSMTPSSSSVALLLGASYHASMTTTMMMTMTDAYPVHPVSLKRSTRLLSASTMPNSRDMSRSNGNDNDSDETVTPQVAAAATNDNNDNTVDWDWEQLAADVFDETDQRPIVLFDGVCNLCNGGVNFAMDQDESAKLRFCSLQSKVAQSLLLRSGKSPHDTSNICLITKDEAYFSSNAVSRICMELDALPLQWFGQLGQVTPDWIRESMFQLVSTNRYQFGESDSCRLDFDGIWTSRFVSDPVGDEENEESSSS